MAAGPHECMDAPSVPPPSAPEVVDALTAARGAHPGAPLEALHDLLRRLAAAAPVGWTREDPADPTRLPETVRRGEAVRDAITGLLADAVAAGTLSAATDVAGLARAVHVAQQGSIAVWATVGRGPFAAALRHDVEAALAPHRAT